MPGRHYYKRREPGSWDRGGRLEMIVTAAVVVLVVSVLIVFLVVYHDFPLRVSGP